jgi:altered-inheritance-of-mitochondria protein 13
LGKIFAQEESILTPIALQNDSTRSKQQELAYQQRLTSELEKVRQQEVQNLSKLSETLSDDLDKPSEPSLVEKLADVTSLSSVLPDKQKQKDMTRDIVTKEIEALKKKLDGRKKIEQVDPQLQKAKAEVVACLRTNDRRPLDCWQEIAKFKQEVGRLEKEFVEKTIR